jgi:DNA-binding XRE family transcriptional regulator
LQKLRRGMAICCHCHNKFDAPEGVATMRRVFCPSCLDTLPDIPFGRRIASLRIIVGFTQGELADRAGISAKTLVLLEASKHKPHRRTRDRLLAGLLPALAKVRRVRSR